MKCIAKLVVGDLAAMTDFYAAAFDMSPKTTIESETVVETILSGGDGQGNVILYHYKDDRALTLGTAYGPLVFIADDVDSVYHRALVHGGAALSPPVTVDFRGPDGPGTLRVAFLTDPEGHPIEIASIEVNAFVATTQIVTL